MSLTITSVSRQVGSGLPVKLQDRGAIHGGEAQKTQPPQEDAAKHAGLNVEDQDLKDQGLDKTLMSFNIDR